MVMIGDLSTYVGNIAEGLFRLTKVMSVSHSDSPSTLVAVLEDCTGQIHCHHWQYDAASVERTSNVFFCQLFIKYHDDGIAADLMSAQPYKDNTAAPLPLLPWSSLPRPHLVAELHTLVEYCPIVALRNFINAVFSKEDFALPFFQFPASREHHHAYSGGLAEHSLEVANIVQAALWQASEDEFWLATVAGLLHDVGKLRTFKNGGNRSNIGFVMQHDQLTLEVLAEPLKQLDIHWPDGAIALRYLLTRSPQESKRPLMPCSLAIDYADKMSSAQSTHKQAFNQKPEWQRFAKLNAKGPRSLFWRPSPSDKFQGVIA